jgi:cysteine desulfurase
MGIMAIYLDNAATTFLDSRVKRAMDRAAGQRLGNASAQHRAGIRAAMAVEKSRQALASALGADPAEIYFFSGGTEVNNTVIKGAVFARRSAGDHVIVSAVEHASVLEPARWLEHHGFRVSYAGVDGEGRVSPSEVKRLLTPQTILVSVMQANNEIGTIQPVQAIGRICRARGIFFHTDACQSFTKVPLDVRHAAVDAVTISGHKIHGPRGVGVLYLRRGVRLDPLLHGGAQEGGLRPGTYNTEAVAGLGEAVRIASASAVERMTRLRDYFIAQVETAIPRARLNGSRRERLCNNVNFSFDGVTGKALFAALNRRNIFVSTGSACAANALTPSHVLMALGVSRERADGAIRLSLGQFTTRKDIDAVVKALKIAVAQLRAKA